MINESLIAAAILCSGITNKTACENAARAGYVQSGTSKIVDSNTDKLKGKIEILVEEDYPGGTRGATFTVFSIKTISERNIEYPILLYSKYDTRVKLTPTLNWRDQNTILIKFSITW